MTEEQGVGEVLVHLSYIREGIDAINKRLDKLNGRVGLSEGEIAKHGTAIALIEDRATEARQAARRTGAKVGASVGAGAAAAMAALWNHFLGR